MIIPETFKARGGVSFIYPDDAIEAMKDELRDAIVRGGEGFGAFIRRESVFFSVRDDNTRHERIVTGYWCPDPREGVEFRGGPNDGKVLPVGTSHTRPPPVYRLPPEYSPPSIQDWSESAIMPQFSMSIGDYRLAGIDSALDRWVYEFAA